MFFLVITECLSLLIGAGRLELCSSLMEGGLTPSLGEHSSLFFLFFYRYSYTTLTSAETRQAHNSTRATFICFAIGLLQVVKQYVKIPVYVMIRPRGGDFLYSDQEVEVMRKDIELMKSHGADGLVLGALTEDGRIDTELCMELLGIVWQYV